MEENCDLFQGDQVCNELEAYLLGFFYADGCVSQFKNGSYRVFSISLAEKDKDYLQWITDVINNCLHSNYTIKYSVKTKSYRLCVCKKDFIYNIIKLGITHNKTYEDSDFVFNNVPNSLKHHFVRGYFDGDGSIYQNKSRKYVTNIISLNKTLIQSIYNFCYLHLGHGSVRSDKKYYRFHMSGNPSVYNFGKFLYNDANYYMSRKKDKFDNIELSNKKNKYVGITSYFNKYKVSIWDKHTKSRVYLGLCLTVKEAVELYNSNCEKYNQLLQEYQGEELYYE